MISSFQILSFHRCPRSSRDVRVLKYVNVYLAVRNASNTPERKRKKERGKELPVTVSKEERSFYFNDPMAIL